MGWGEFRESFSLALSSLLSKPECFIFEKLSLNTVSTGLWASNTLLSLRVDYGDSKPTIPKFLLMIFSFLFSYMKIWEFLRVSVVFSISLRRLLLIYCASFSTWITAFYEAVNSWDTTLCLLSAIDECLWVNWEDLSIIIGVSSSFREVLDPPSNNFRGTMFS